MSKFEELISDEKIVLVEFYAAWSQQCMSMNAVLSELKNSFGDKIRIVKIDIEKNKSITAQYNIQSYPTILLFRNGQQLWRHSGFMPFAELKKTINSFTKTPCSSKIDVHQISKTINNFLSILKKRFRLSKDNVKGILTLLVLVGIGVGWYFIKYGNHHSKTYHYQDYSTKTSVVTPTEEPVMVTCDECNGRGLLTCSNCRGRGLITKFGGEETVCPVCYGVPDPCQKCQMSGKIDRKRITPRPVSTSGSGYSGGGNNPVIMGGQTGSSVMPTTVEPISHSRSSERIPCQDCNTSGKCKHCGGVGKRVQDVGMYIGETCNEVVDCPFCSNGNCSMCYGKGFY